MDVAPSQMMGFPFIDWCGGGFCADGTVEAETGPVGAAAAARADVADAPVVILFEDAAGAVFAVATGVGWKVGALAERRGAVLSYVRP